MKNLWSSISGKRALILGDYSLDYIQLIAERFDDVILVIDPIRAPGAAAELLSVVNARTAQIEHPPLMWDPGYFDGIFTLNFLFPRLNWSEWLTECLRVLKPRGHILFVEPYPSFPKSAGWTVKAGKLWKEVIEQLPNDIAKELISPDNITNILKEKDIHHLRTHANLSVLAENAGNWLPESTGREIFLDKLLPTLQRTDVRQETQELIEGITEAIAEKPQADMAVKIYSGLKRRPQTPVLIVEKTQITEPEIEIESPAESPEEQPEMPLDEDLGDSWRVIWSDGPESLSDADLLAVVVEEDVPTKRLRKTCKKMLKQYGSVALAQEQKPRALHEAFKLNRRQAIRLVAAFELGRRFIAKSSPQEIVLLTADDVYNYLHDMGTLKKEHLRGLYLDGRGKLLRDDVLALGSMTTSTVNPRDVFASALECYATSIILVHNHPSGDPKPSPEDIYFTKQVKQAGQMMGVDLIDHIVISGSSYVSMNDAKLI